MRVHRDGETSPQERPRASEEEEKMVVDDTSSTDEILFPKPRLR